MKSRLLSFPIAIAVATLLSGCPSPDSRLSAITGSLPSMPSAKDIHNFLSPPDSFQHVYMALDTSTEETIKTSKQAIHELKLLVSSSDFVAIDVISRDRLNVHYSHDVPSLVTISNVWKEIPHYIPVTVEGFLAALGRAREYAIQNPDTLINAFIVTRGTQDPDELSRIRAVAENMTDAPNLRLTLIGVSPEARLKTASQFAPIAPQIKVFVSRQEWIDTLQGTFSREVSHHE